MSTTKEKNEQIEIIITSSIFKLSFMASRIIRYEKENSAVVREVVMRTTVSSSVEMIRNIISATRG